MNSRLVKILKIIKESLLDAVALIAGPNLKYITGADFHLMERPTILIISKNFKPVAILPHLEVDSFKVSDFNAEIISWKDSEGFYDAFIKAGKMIGNLKKIGVEGQRMRVFEFDIIKKAFPDAEVIDTHKEIVKIRLCKDEEEIQNLRKAIKISEDALEKTIGNLKEGVSELQIVQDLIVNQYDGGAHSLAFNPIALIGENAALPHGHSGERKLKKGDLILINKKLYNGYNSGAGEFGMLPYLDRNFEDYCSGQFFQKINGIALHKIDDTVTSYLEKSSYNKCIIHRTGHGLGLDVHEDPYVVRGNNQKLEKGMIITIEPGLYDQGNVGVRIEDNVLVNDGGFESLTNLSRELTILG